MTSMSAQSRGRYRERMNIHISAGWACGGSYLELCVCMCVCVCVCVCVQK